MKRFKGLGRLTIGFILGAAAMATVTASGASDEVTAIISRNLMFEINGNVFPQPEEYPILNYNSRVYVPIRFVGDKMDSNVSWDPITKKVKLLSKNSTVTTTAPTETVKEEVIKEVIVYVNESGGKEGIIYKELPTGYSGIDFDIEVKAYSRDTNTSVSRVYIYVKNKKDMALQLSDSDSLLIVDGKEISPSKYYGLWDNTWAGDIGTNKEVEGYLTFDIMPEEWKEASLRLKTKTMQSNGEYKERTIQINFLK